MSDNFPETSKELLRLFIENTPAAVAMFDLEMRYIIASRRFLVDYHLKEQDIAGRLHYEIFPDIPESWKDIHRRCLAGAVEKAEADPFQRSDGSTDWVRWEIHPWHDANGKIGGIILFSEVITERIKAEKELQEREKFFRSTFEQAAVGIAHLSPEGNFIRINQKFCDIVGYRKEEMLARTFLSITHHADLDTDFALVKQLLSGKTQTYTMEKRYFRKDGSIVWVNLTVSLVRKDDLSPDYFISVVDDITQRKTLELLLKDNERNFYDLFNNLNSGVAVYEVVENGRDFIFKYFNKTAERIDHQSKEELIGKSIFEIRPGIEKFGLIETFKEVIETKHPMNHPISFYKDEKRDGYYKNYVFLLPNGDLVAVFDDLTESINYQNKLKKAKEQAEENAKKYRIVSENASDWEFWIGNDGKYIYISPACEEITGYTPEEFMKNSDLITYIIHPDDKVLFVNHLCSREEETRIGDLIFRIIRKDGGIKWISHTCKNVYDEKNNNIWRRGSNKDITEIKNNEKLLESRLFLREYAINHSLEETMQAALDKAEELTLSKIAFFHFFEEDENTINLQIWSTNTLKNMCTAAGKGLHYPLDKAGVWADCIHQRKPLIHNDYQGISNKKGIPEGHVPVTCEMVIPIFQEKRIVAILGVGNKPGNYSEFDLRILKDFCNSIWDIIHQKRTDESRKRLEIQLRQAQKMESIGTLAGGIAHDFNNILSLIFGYTEIAKKRLASDSSVQPSLTNVLNAAERAKELVRQILTFSRQTEQERKPLQISVVLKESIKLLRASIPTTIQIKHDIDNNAGNILGDPTQINQTVMNLCTNAFHAMKEKGGLLTISLKPVEISQYDKKANSFEITAPGHYVVLEISDTGCGMDNKTIERIFEPYFTTKEKGEGTGLGLAIVHGIVQSSKGHISVYSEPGKGTTFKIYLPGIESEIITHEVIPDKALPGGNERILFVDDEEFIVGLTKTILEDLGYKVTCFIESQKALEEFTANPDNFDVVISDMTMPELTGKELFERVRAVRSDIPFIICTGFSELINREEAINMGINEYISKPFMQRDFANAVRKALDGAKNK